MLEILMTDEQELARLGVYDARAPRYTSYPTAVQFGPDIGPKFTEETLSSLPTDKAVSVYIHIPFCERLCWFCACRTQGTKSASPVAAYLKQLIAEIDRVAEKLPKGIKARRIHWGGGTPTILTPEQIHLLANSLERKIPRTDDAEFSVEIDPTLVNQAKIDALIAAGMTRASIGVQDFALKVQNAIGRLQNIEITQECIAMLRRANISSLNMDILYGLPHQTKASVLDTIHHVLALSPDRIALYGYAHVPWMAKRQQLIDESALPDGKMRHTLFQTMAYELEGNGYDAVGIDHFAKPTDTLAIAYKTGQLRRNFQGYTTDNMETLIGLGASSISKYPHGYTQNSANSSEYTKAIESGEFATYRGVKTTFADRIIGRTIEMIMCNFEVDYSVLKKEFNDDLSCLNHATLRAQKDFNGIVEFSVNGFKIIKHKRSVARLVAKDFDQYIDSQSQFSAVS
jgi:oxygen-independent coproporphyrinogen-3 oxidase